VTTESVLQADVPVVSRSIHLSIHSFHPSDACLSVHPSNARLTSSVPLDKTRSPFNVGAVDAASAEALHSYTAALAAATDSLLPPRSTARPPPHMPPRASIDGVHPGCRAAMPPAPLPAGCFDDTWRRHSITLPVRRACKTSD
jgi:hypothetical protein